MGQAKRFDWERIIRRVLGMEPSTKLVALLLATYANKDGTSVRPGRKMLAAVSGLSVRTVDRHLDELRRLGLIERVTKGSNLGTKDVADTYRLAIPDNLLDVIDLLPPRELPDQSPPVTSGQSSPVTTGEAEPVDMGDEPVDMGDYYQSSPMTQPVVTHDDLPDHDHPVTKYKDHSAALRPAVASATCGCVAGWIDHATGAMPCPTCRPEVVRRLKARERGVA